MRGTRVAWARRALAILPAVVLAASTLGAAAPAGAQSDPAADADRNVSEAQARADRAADAYFDALERDQQLDRDIADLEAEVDQLDKQVARLRTLTVARAVEAYKRSGTPFANTFGDSADITETVRRLALLEAVNGRDRDAADAFQEARADRADRQADLKAAKAEQAATLDELRAEEAHLNEVLAKAQDERRALAARQAAAAAAAAQPAATPSGSTPTTTTAPAGSAAAAPNTPNAPSAPATPSPSPPAPDYVPKTGTHPHHDDPFLVCTRQRESSGNYQAYNPAGPFYGAYQFLQSTWNSAANHAGRGDLVGIDPRTASQYDQDDMAWTLYQWRGKGPWNGFC